MLSRMPTVLASSLVRFIARCWLTMDKWLDKSTRERCMISRNPPDNPGYFEAQICGGCFASQSVVLFVESRTSTALVLEPRRARFEQEIAHANAFSLFGFLQDLFWVLWPLCLLMPGCCRRLLCVRKAAQQWGARRITWTRSAMPLPNPSTNSGASPS